jgi:CRP/FNR family transcriptional regulator, cyclic AMP receptor protein
METKTFKKGDIIIEKGSHETCAYVIESGKVEIKDLVNKKAVLTVLGEKQIFGEIGLVEDKPRSATVTAIEDVRLNVIIRDNFNELFEKNPKVLLPIIKSLFERLKTANKMLISKDTPGDEKSVEHKGLGGVRVVALSGISEAGKDALNDREMEISKFPFKVGREQRSSGRDVFSDTGLYLRDSQPLNVSRNHFSIDKVGDEVVITDRGSTLGTIVNGVRIKDQRVLNKKVNEIAVGTCNSPFIFRLEIR